MPGDYNVEISPRAKADLESLSSEVAVRISKKMKELAQDPRPRSDTIKRLQGLAISTYRLRVGDYRAVFRIHETTVRVLRVIHRSQLERGLGDIA